MAETDILEVLAFTPDHVSLYELTVEENTELYKSIAAGKLTPMEHRLSAAVYSRQQALLETNGYSRYEISNYAISGQESKHNLGYWKLTPYLGIGPSAASTLPGAHGPVRLSARASLPEWNYQAEQIAPDDFLFEHIMMGMRLSEGIDRYRICRIFGYLPEEYYPETVKKWKQQKLLSLSKSNLALINGGTDFLNTFLSDILEEEPKKPIFPKPCWPE
jgi:oxygen-independent coproporphyrinogen-3 oxidase